VLCIIDHHDGFVRPHRQHMTYTFNSLFMNLNTYGCRTFSVAGPAVWNTRPSVQTVLKRICSLDTSAFSVLEVLDDNCTL